MTTVTQTEAFAKLDEGTVKDFIMKVFVTYLYQKRKFLSLNCILGCTSWCLQILKASYLLHTQIFDASVFCRVSQLHNNNNILEFKRH